MVQITIRKKHNKSSGRLYIRRQIISQTEEKFRFIVLHVLQEIIIKKKEFSAMIIITKFKEKIHPMKEKKKKMKSDLINFSKKSKREK